MAKTFSLQQLTEGIRQRHLGSQNRRLVDKWTRTGLLRGLDGVHRENMAALLENQASQMLKESNSVGTGGGAHPLAASGDLRGFTNIAFPIVRRVFGGLVANELVSIQPMSLPSGLLFYLDYTYGTNVGTSGTASTYVTGSSIYNSPSGKSIREGSDATGGQYDLAGSGYTRVHQKKAGIVAAASLFGAYGANDTWADGVSGAGKCAATGTDGKLLSYDPEITKLIEDDAADGAQTGSGQFMFLMIPYNVTNFGDATTAQVDGTAINQISVSNIDGGGTASSPAAGLGTTIQGGSKVQNVRRLNRLGTWDSSAKVWVDKPLATTATANAHVLTVVTASDLGNDTATYTVTYVKADQHDTTAPDTLVIPSFESDFAADPAPEIPEIDIKIESIAVVAQTRKLRAKWSPELAQDLNAYHSLDAEVELTQILSEQIALELDREILNDLLTQAGTSLYWSRAPGKFVNKETGAEVSRGSTLNPGPAFTGTVREWYETLVETVIDCANTIHRKTLRGAANFMVVSPDVATMLEASVLYRPNLTLDGDGQVGVPFSLGAEKTGTLSNRFTVYKDPYFPRNKILVGYKGGSYLETGYVYAPYVPLIVTPTIFAPEDFTPRKGVMTRYGKKMVRADFYGTVTVQDLNII